MLSITVANLFAIRQKDLKRFMAYSSIAQAGYIMVALLGEPVMAKTAIIYYLFVYAVSNYLAFFVFGIIGHHREETFSSLRGLSKQNPSLAIALAISMFSLAGIPPLAGFFGKFHLFFSGATTGHYGLIAFAVLNNVLALFYYLQLVKSAWVDEPDGHLNPLRLTRRQRGVIILLSCAVIILGALPFLSDNIFSGFSG